MPGLCRLRVKGPENPDEGRNEADRRLPSLARAPRGLLAWSSDHLSTGPLEGTNNRIKRLQRRADGDRDFELLKLRILDTAHHAL